jgi:hypothetical protein
MGSGFLQLRDGLLNRGLKLGGLGAQFAERNLLSLSLKFLPALE